MMGWVMVVVSRGYHSDYQALPSRLCVAPTTFMLDRVALVTWAFRHVGREAGKGWALGFELLHLTTVGTIFTLLCGQTLDRRPRIIRLGKEVVYL